MYIGSPLAPINLNTTVLSRGDTTLTVNLTWYQDSSCYVIIYYVEETDINTTAITNMTTTSQHITLTLQIGVEYSFRVRGADTINRLGEWSESLVRIYMHSPSTRKLLNNHNTFSIIYI